MANSANSGRERLYRPRHERNDDGRVFRARGWSSRYTAKIAVVDFPIVVVLDLHHLVANAVGRAEALDADLAGRIERLLQIDVERARAEAAAVHRA
jgi:hypothetical protein